MTNIVIEGQKLQVILGINLVDQILAKQILAKSGSTHLEWATSREVVEDAVEEFTKFFLLAALNFGEPLVPTAKQDDVWHEFMLRPVAYYEACMKIAGFIIDHKPLSSSDQDEVADLEIALKRTQLLWETFYGEPHPAQTSTAWCGLFRRFHPQDAVSLISIRPKCLRLWSLPRT
jgi:hypothetical protein